MTNSEFSIIVDKASQVALDMQRQLDGHSVTSLTTREDRPVREAFARAVIDALEELAMSPPGRADCAECFGSGCTLCI